MNKNTNRNEMNGILDHNSALVKPRITWADEMHFGLMQDRSLDLFTMLPLTYHGCPPNTNSNMRFSSSDYNKLSSLKATILHYKAIQGKGLKR